MFKYISNRISNLNKRKKKLTHEYKKTPKKIIFKQNIL